MQEVNPSDRENIKNQTKNVYRSPLNSEENSQNLQPILRNTDSNDNHAASSYSNRFKNFNNYNSNSLPSFSQSNPTVQNILNPFAKNYSSKSPRLPLKQQNLIINNEKNIMQHQTKHSPQNNQKNFFKTSLKLEPFLTNKSSHTGHNAPNANENKHF